MILTKERRARKSKANEKLRRKVLNVNVMALLCKMGWQRHCRTQVANKLLYIFFFLSLVTSDIPSFVWKKRWSIWKR